jgi:hypothetical protein
MVCLIEENRFRYDSIYEYLNEKPEQIQDLIDRYGIKETEATKEELLNYINNKEPGKDILEFIDCDTDAIAVLVEKNWAGLNYVQYIDDGNNGHILVISFLPLKAKEIQKDTTIKIEVYRGLVSKVENLPEGYDYQINDLDENN